MKIYQLNKHFISVSFKYAYKYTADFDTHNFVAMGTSITKVISAGAYCSGIFAGFRII